MPSGTRGSSPTRGRLNSGSSEEWRREGERLGILRNQLNAYVRALHKVHPNRWSAYRAMGEVISNTDVPNVSISWPDPDSHSADDYDRLLETVRKIDAIVRPLGGVDDVAALRKGLQSLCD